MIKMLLLIMYLFRQIKNNGQTLYDLWRRRRRRRRFSALVFI